MEVISNNEIKQRIAMEEMIMGTLVKKSYSSEGTLEKCRIQDVSKVVHVKCMVVIIKGWGVTQRMVAHS